MEGVRLWHYADVQPTRREACWNLQALRTIGTWVSRSYAFRKGSYCVDRAVYGNALLERLNVWQDKR